jgi:Domain of unknown function (DUF1840)
MLISFHSKACADFFMLSAHAHVILELMGKSLTTQGVIAAADLEGCLNQLHAAVLLDEAQALKETADSQNDADDDSAEDDPYEQASQQPAPVRLKQRAWPLMDMMRQAHAKQVDVLWGV